MKKIFLLMLLFAGLSFGQTVKTLPVYHSWTNVYNDTLKGAAVNTSGWDAKQWRGVNTVHVYMDTIDAGTPSALSVGLQLYCKEVMEDGKVVARNVWMDYYSGNTLSTIAAAAWAATDKYLILSEFGQHGWADSIKLVLTPNAADTGIVIIDVGGQ
jgi:hypothetical protein